MTRQLVPRQLPAEPRQFTGRARESARLSALLGARDGPRGAASVAAVGGIGGIGKTWLALHWAHRNLDRFPDGQLFADLRGFNPAGQAADPAAVLGGFLDALGVAPDELPSGVDARSGLYRSLLADRRMLIVLDNARDTAQVSPLIPAGAGCAVLVTSRRRLAGLITGYGACALDLGPLSAAEARELLDLRLGRAATAAEPEATAEVLACCAGLPLAISVVAARGAPGARPSLGPLAAELRGAPTPLDGLDAGEPAADVRAVLTSSVRALSPAAAELFRLLGIVPGADIGLPAAASLAALPPRRAAEAVRELQNAYLLEQRVHGRHRMHDLVRHSAADLARRERAGPELDAALIRLIDFYTHSAVAALRLLDPHPPLVPLGEPAAGCLPLSPAYEADAMAWFGEEHTALLATQRLAERRGWYKAAWRLAWSLGAFYWHCRHAVDDLKTWRFGLAASDTPGDPPVRTRARQGLTQTTGSPWAPAVAGDIVRG